MGHGVDGAFAPFAVVRPDQLYRLPDHVGLDEGALCEPFAAAVQPVEELGAVRAGDVVLLSGPGPIGLAVPQAPRGRRRADDRGGDRPRRACAGGRPGRSARTGW